MGWSSSSSSSSPRNQQQQPLNQNDYMHKTKTIYFLGRSTPIVLQNDNGPCPLLAICNVLLLRNVLHLNPDIAEVSQQKLLSLIAERLIDSNSNVNNKEADIVENQRQNISDAMDLLPKLATGIDVNVKFRRIDDFEFTPECAIFDLLDIPLYHGWIVDPQDYDSANAIGSKSYNELMEELVTLETQNSKSQHNNSMEEEDRVVLAAATTAALGVPSPSLLNASSFDGSPQSLSDQQIPRKGDLEANAELLRVLKLSEADPNASVSDSVVGHANGGAISVCIDGNMYTGQVIAVDSGMKLEKNFDVGNNDLHEPEPSLADDCSPSGKDSNELISSAHTLGEAANSSIKTNKINGLCQLTYIGSDESIVENDVSVRFGQVHNQSTLTTSNHEAAVEPRGYDATGLSSLLTSHTNSDLSSVIFQQTDASVALGSTVDGNEPIYEEQECVLNTTANFEDSEPAYEAEVVLAEQADKISFAAFDLRAKDEINPQQGELIKCFLRNNASQLTFYGLFCLQDGLKERELCVFFRNNHFSTVFKFEGELYLLATDQGYLNQFDLVWEKLNEVNGDTLFMTGDFREFKVESQENSTWDEDHAIKSTADYLASIGSASETGLHINSDLQLAIALQQQEFEQQQSGHNSEESTASGIGGSRLVTGSQVARNSGRYSSPFSTPEAKSKERCIVM